MQILGINTGHGALVIGGFVLEKPGSLSGPPVDLDRPSAEARR